MSYFLNATGGLPQILACDTGDIKFIPFVLLVGPPYARSNNQPAAAHAYQRFFPVPPTLDGGTGRTLPSGIAELRDPDRSNPSSPETSRLTAIYRECFE